MRKDKERGRRQQGNQFGSPPPSGRKLGHQPIPSDSKQDIIDAVQKRRDSKQEEGRARREGAQSRTATSMVSLPCETASYSAKPPDRQASRSRSS